MEINNIIREQICSDLKAGLVDEAGGPMVATFFNGQPTFISVPEFENDESDIPLFLSLFLKAKALMKISKRLHGAPS